MPALRTFQQLSASFSWALNIDGMLRTNGINTPVSIITSCSLQKTSSSSGTFMYHYDVLLVFPMEFCSFALDIPDIYIRNSERLKDYDHPLSRNPPREHMYQRVYITSRRREAEFSLSSLPHCRPGCAYESRSCPMADTADRDEETPSWETDRLSYRSLATGSCPPIPPWFEAARDEQDTH